MSARTFMKPKSLPVTSRRLSLLCSCEPCHIFPNQSEQTEPEKVRPCHCI